MPITVNCTTRQQVDSLWRMLCHVPDGDFEPVVVQLEGKLLYRIIRANGEQTTVPL
jgi:hypothetical protein